jgi:hypothetical protein
VKHISVFLLLILCNTTHCECQLQKRTDFYGIRLSVANKQEIKRDLTVSWFDRVKVDPTDEDTRALLHIVERLEARRLHLNKVFKFNFIGSGDVSGIIHNRIFYRLPDAFLETPRTYEVLEYCENFLLYDVDVSYWRLEKERLDKQWESNEWTRKLNFILKLSEAGKDIYEAYYYMGEDDEGEEVAYLDGKLVTYQSLGYKPAPKPKHPAKPSIPKAVYGFSMRE